MLTIEANAAHIWIMDFTRFNDERLLESYRNLLSDEELERLGRFAFPYLQHNYLVTRAMVRTCLSHYVDIPPQEWRFGANDNGKPFVLNPGLPLTFNLSHSGERAALAISSTHSVGIDIEQLSRKRDWLGIAQHYFHLTEVEQLMAQPEEAQCGFFFRLWTLKEAYLKARGTGISTGLDKAYFTFSNDLLKTRFAPELNDNVALWQFFNYELGTEYSLSLALTLEHAAKAQITFFQSWPLDESRSISSLEDPIIHSFRSALS